MTMQRRPAAFLDRDGVLNVDHGYVGHVEQFEWLPGVPQALRRLQRAGYALVVVTNQSGIARGLYTESDLARLTQHMRAELTTHGVTLDALYYCPHHPEAGVIDYRQACDCRKPRPGMITRAIDELRLDAARSCLFGDNARDIAAGRAAGIRHCWLLAAETVQYPADANSASMADGIARNLTQAVERQLALLN